MTLPPVPMMVRPAGANDAASFHVASFHVPPELEAKAPPEARGLQRDEVRLLVARKGTGQLDHRRFIDLPALLEAGDVLVINTSATLPAALAAIGPRGEPAALHLSGRLPGGLWVVEPRHHDGRPASPTTPWLDARPNTTLELPAGGRAELAIPAVAGRTASARLWVAELALPEPLLPYLARHGRPIRYAHVPEPWPISYYQTVFAEEPGSAEMPSAARPFSAELVTRLAARGVRFAPFVLHCGVSSPEGNEPPAAEWYKVPATSAALINSARRRGHRVIAVGTTAVRAIETVADAGGHVHPGQGWTELVVGPESPPRAIDGLITGWHEPGASHLQLLEALAGSELLAASYQQALAAGYLWHEFGDSNLVMP